MRKFPLALLATLSIAGSSSAYAADLDDDFLRGTDYEPPVALVAVDWNGIYLGGHGGYSSAALGFNNVFQPIVTTALRETYFESSMNASSLIVTRPQRVEGPSYGVYAGWNYQLDETVVGVEVDYTRFATIGSSENNISRFNVSTDGLFHSISLKGLSSTKIEDYGTIRARGGYAMGNFLPFLTGGLAIGRAQIADTVDVRTYEYDQAAYRANAVLTDPSHAVAVQHNGYANFNPKYPDPSSPPADPKEPKSTLAAPVRYGNAKTKTVGGIALGAGIEYAITPSILLRAEYQYVLFNDFDGHKANVNTVRGGAAVKF